MVSVSLRASNQENSELPTRDRSTDLRISRFDALSRRDRKLYSDLLLLGAYITRGCLPTIYCWYNVESAFFFSLLGKYKQILSVWSNVEMIPRTYSPKYMMLCAIRDAQCWGITLTEGLHKIEFLPLPQQPRRRQYWHLGIWHTAC